MSDDPVLARRARIARLAALGKRIGYSALLVAIASFIAGVVTSFATWTVVVSTIGLVAACVILPIPIVLGYGVRAPRPAKIANATREARHRVGRIELGASSGRIEISPNASVGSERRRVASAAPKEQLMRYRRFGQSDLVVSEVGFGTWTLVTDWWGRTDHPHAMITAALDAGINFIDTAPVYGTEGAGESILAPYLTVRDDIVITTKCGYDIKAERKFPGQSERPADWRPESIRQQCEDSLRRLGTDRIDLYQLHNPRIEPILADDLWEALLELKHQGKVRELGVALGPAIGWVEEGLRSIDDRPIVSLQTVFNALEQEPGRTFAQRPRVQHGEISLISRVPHASDSLSGKADADTVFPKGDHRAHRNRDNMLDNFEKAATLSFLWEPETTRTIGQAAIAAILADPAFTCVLPTVLSVDDVREYAAASDSPLTADERQAVDALWARNFDHVDRYVMPLKSSV